MSIKVLNRGIGGEDARQMLPRLDRDLAAEKPDLVLWQVGTNALLSERGIDSQGPLIREGLRKISTAGADVIQMDPQYAPYVLRDPDARPMVALLAKIGEETGVPVFRRFALMQFWHEAREIAFSDILAPDLFHMNDWSYGCLARNLAAALVANARTTPAESSSSTIVANRAPVSAPVAATPVTASR
jgi:lysophospholipase L1-like esterase